MKKMIWIVGVLVLTIAISANFVDAQNKARLMKAQSQRIANPSEQIPKKIEKKEGFAVLRGQSDNIIPANFEEMVNTSDMIVIGRPLQSVAESTALVKRDREGHIYEAISQTEFMVSQVLKGNPDSNIILVGQQAAIVQDQGDPAAVMRVVDDYQPLVKNAKYMLFLKKGLEGSSLYFPLSLNYGKINIDGNDEGEKRTKFSNHNKVVRAEVFKRYRDELNQALNE